MEVTYTQEVLRALPELDDEKFMALVEHLSSELGVTKKEDLALVEPDDLLQHLKPIQRHRFIQAFKPIGEKNNTNRLKNNH